MKQHHRIIAPLSVVISIPVGMVLAIPSAMALGAPNLKTHMKLFGYSGLSIFPVAVAACITSLVYDSPIPLFVNALPYLGFAIGAIVDVDARKSINSSPRLDQDNPPTKS